MFGCTYELFGYTAICYENVFLTIVFGFLAAFLASGFIISIVHARRYGSGIAWGAAVLMGLSAFECFAVTVGFDTVLAAICF